MIATIGKVIEFQFTPLREGRPISESIGLASDLFQFTPLREGRHEIVTYYT